MGIGELAKTHDSQIETTTDLVRRLLATRFPQWSGLPTQPVQESGTDHADPGPGISSIPVMTHDGALD